MPEDDSLPLSARLANEHTLKKYPSVRHFWARDMYYTRNSFAHGSKERTQTPATWRTEEHLLVAAFIFPLCLKIELAGKGLYQLTDLWGMIPYEPPEDDGLDHEGDPLPPRPALPLAPPSPSLRGLPPHPATAPRATKATTTTPLGNGFMPMTASKARTTGATPGRSFMERQERDLVHARASDS